MCMHPTQRSLDCVGLVQGRYMNSTQSHMQGLLCDCWQIVSNSEVRKVVAHQRRLRPASWPHAQIHPFESASTVLSKLRTM
jgi:hypothetical protein